MLRWKIKQEKERVTDKKEEASLSKDLNKVREWFHENIGESTFQGEQVQSPWVKLGVFEKQGVQRIRTSWGRRKETKKLFCTSEMMSFLAAKSYDWWSSDHLDQSQSREPRTTGRADFSFRSSTSTEAITLRPGFSPEVKRTLGIHSRPSDCQLIPRIWASRTFFCRESLRCSLYTNAWAM